MSDLLSNNTITRRAFWIVTILSICGAMTLLMGVHDSQKPVRIVPPPVAFAPSVDNPGGYSPDPDAEIVSIGGAKQFPAPPLTPKSGAIVALPVGTPLASIYGDNPGWFEEFVDDEPVLYVKTSVWAATSDYVWQLYPNQSQVAHERTVFYRVLALQLRHPDVNWGVVAYWTPFMSVRGVAG